MARVKGGYTTRRRHKKIISMAKGYRGRSKSCFRIAVQRVEKALQYAYRDRRNKKRDFRRLWIQRINAGARLNGLTYSQFIGGLHKKDIAVNRKILSELSVNQPEAFAAIVDAAKV
jgi:large subunit ribosomal protein L20